MAVFIFACTFGPFCIYESRKTNAKLLFQIGLGVGCMGPIYMTLTLDFFTILLTGKNIGIYGTTIPGSSIYWSSVLVWMWIAPAYVLGLNVGITLLMPQKKRYFMPVYFVLGIVYEICIFYDYEGSVVTAYPANPGNNIIEEIIVIGSPAFFIIVIFTLSFLIFNGFGLFIKGLQLTGIVRKKYLLLSSGFFMITIFGLLEQTMPPGFIAIFIRLGFLSSFWLWYLGLREEPEKVKKGRPKKEVKVEESLFRISKRPDHITQEEISISKEKKICLVCKGKIAEFNFVCPECEAFYCVNCAQAISNLENACWVCNTPIDKSKPSKPFKKEEEALDLELSEESKKTPQKTK